MREKLSRDVIVFLAGGNVLDLLVYEIKKKKKGT